MTSKIRNGRELITILQQVPKHKYVLNFRIKINQNQKITDLVGGSEGRTLRFQIYSFGFLIEA